jgi:uncharacterized protein (DUF433 family)
MPLELKARPVPLKTTPEGAIWVGGTRVTLDTVVGCYWDGITAEGIVEQYPTLRLADVYAVIGYYLDHTSEVDEYLRAREAHGEQIRRENESRFPPDGARARLLARKALRSR